jgi:hypothetical protein
VISLQILIVYIDENGNMRSRRHNIEIWNTAERNLRYEQSTTNSVEAHNKIKY